MAEVSLFLRLYTLLASMTVTVDRAADIVDLDASSTIADADLLESIVIDWGDGNTVTFTDLADLQNVQVHDYGSDGTWSITMTVTDVSGRTSVATIGVDTSPIGFPYTFDFELS